MGQHLVWVPCKVPCAFQEASSCRDLGVFTQPCAVLGNKGAMHFVPGPGNTEVSTSVTHPSQQPAQLSYWKGLAEYAAFISVLWSSRIERKCPFWTGALACVLNSGSDITQKDMGATYGYHQVFSFFRFSVASLGCSMYLCILYAFKIGEMGPFVLRSQIVVPWP